MSQGAIIGVGSTPVSRPARFRGSGKTEWLKSIPVMPDWRIELIAREEIAYQTIAFHFRKPQSLGFIAGQFVDLTLIDSAEMDSAGASRAFTIASAPFKDRLMFAMSMRDTAFKRTLQGLPLGCEVRIDDPAGAFTLHRDPSRAAVFLAGGIGITPFRSIIRQAIHDRLPHRIFLFYSNRRPEDAAYLEEFRNVTAENHAFTFVPVTSQMWRSKRSWNG